MNTLTPHPRSRSSSPILVVMTLFSIAMGYLETSVVVYLRKIYYPGGFQFPLVVLDNSIAITELLREAATLVMLGAVGWIAGRNKAERFAYSIYCFAVWDIFYYVFLKALLGWPESFLTWDILFLIPVPWTGPVLAPVVVSLTLIILALAIIRAGDRGREVRSSGGEVTLFSAGALVVFGSFIADYIFHSCTRYVSGDWKGSLETFSSYVPDVFNWWLFGIGIVLMLAAIASFINRTYYEGKVRSSRAY